MNQYFTVRWPKLQADAFKARATDRSPIQLCVIRKGAVHLHSETYPVIKRKPHATQKGNFVAGINPSTFQRVRVPQTARRPPGPAF